MTDIVFRNDIKVEAIQFMGDDEIIAKAARVSTGKDQEDNAKIRGLINYLAREDHTSPFEHTALTVRIEAPIFVAREAMRHRTFSFNEISGRYAKLKPEFYVPDEERPLINTGSGAHPNIEFSTDDWLVVQVETEHERTYRQAWHNYESMLELGVATEVARNVLPVGTYTKWYMTGNLHAWFKFLDLRDGSKGHPQEEIVRLSHLVWPMIEERWPIASTAWKKRSK